MDDRWYAIDPIGRCAELRLAWDKEVTIHQIHSISFCVKVMFETTKKKERMLAIFVYGSNNDRIRQELMTKRGRWGGKWILREDFNDIRCPEKK